MSCRFENTSEQCDWEHVESSNKVDENIADIKTFELDAVEEHYEEDLMAQLREELKTLREYNIVLEEKLADKNRELEDSESAIGELHEEHRNQMAILSIKHELNKELKDIDYQKRVDEIQLLNAKVDLLMKELEMKNVEEAKEKANEVALKPWMVVMSKKIKETNRANEELAIQLFEKIVELEGEKEVLASLEERKTKAETVKKMEKLSQTIQKKAEEALYKNEHLVEILFRRALNNDQCELAKRLIGKYKLQERESKSVPKEIKFRWTTEGTLNMIRVYPKERSSDSRFLYEFEDKMSCKNFTSDSKMSMEGLKHSYELSDFEGAPVNSFRLAFTGDSGNTREYAFKRV